MPSTYWCGPPLGIGTIENPAARGLVVRSPSSVDRSTGRQTQMMVFNVFNSASEAVKVTCCQLGNQIGQN
jgi:hypothetical protein